MNRQHKRVNMFMLLLFLIVSSLVSRAACSRGVASERVDDIRSTNDKVFNDGQLEALIISGSQLVPGQMLQPGTMRLSSADDKPEAYNFYDRSTEQQLEQEQQPQLLRTKGYPYLPSIEFDSGQQLKAVPEEPSQDVVYIFERPQREPPIAAAEQQQRQLQLRQQRKRQESAQQSLANLSNSQRFLSLIGADPVGEKKATLLASDIDSTVQHAAGEESENTRLQQRQRQQQKQQQQHKQQQQTISVSTRTLQTGRANKLNLPKAYISSLLFNRLGASSSLPNFAESDKKAEPKENFFMHFGRR